MVPTHWGIDGKPDAYGSPAFALWFGPIAVAFMMVLTWALPRLSPKQFEVDRSEKTYGMLMFMIALLMAVLHVVILKATAGAKFPMDRAMMVVLGLFCTFFGNQMGRVRRNFYMGVRTPWTLASERVWDLTHRHAASLWFFGGLVVAALALIGIPFGITFTLFMLIMLWPVFDSYLLYRRYEGK
ncbi:hypothetical protein OP10G_0504 [Fimbriimonas ginsengisoli Gsoil 348]|uniref:DUF1648 domain-containing protein n=1 Tax=Fimbriimonas ginsengisoli Gsoil 348 TaxID=661478 RepID=A0A068NK95_FIMGI|nr:hypothetical protein OP10G_0504 [Fimbriimonas ginsengisoli Gsoil 348]